jgi:stage II sporulation protein P
MMPRALLLEVGAQNNTRQEALNAVPPLAAVLATVLLP